MISEKLKKQLQEVHAREQDSFHTEEQFIRAVFAGCDTDEKKTKTVRYIGKMGDNRQ